MKRMPSRPGVRDAVVILPLLLVAGYVASRLPSGSSYEWQWDAMWQYMVRFDEPTGQWRTNLILQGFLTTVRLSVWATSLALVLGTVMGLCRRGRRLFWRLIGGFYVETIRNLPPLVLVFLFYFFVSDRIMPLLGVDILRSQTGWTRTALEFALGPSRFISEFLSAVIALAVFEGAYIAEIVRAGIQGIEREQWEAASALGLSRWQRMRHVIGPQALRHTLPALAGQFISTIKDSSIVSVISIQELTFQGMEVMSATYMTFEIWITVTLLYLALTLTCSLAVAWLEKRLKTPGMIRTN